MQIGRVVLPPADYRRESALSDQWRLIFAQMNATQPAALALDDAQWSALNRINRNVNREIDTAAARGLRADCQQAVRLKQDRLQQAGIPRKALSVAIVRTQSDVSHAILLVATQQGEVALDNLSAWILPWQRLNYRWVERQRSGDPDAWVAVSE